MSSVCADGKSAISFVIHTKSDIGKISRFLIESHNLLVITLQLDFSTISFLTLTQNEKVPSWLENEMGKIMKYSN